jgi:hypothetical protein
MATVQRHRIWQNSGFFAAKMEGIRGFRLLFHSFAILQIIDKEQVMGNAAGQETGSTVIWGVG